MQTIKGLIYTEDFKFKPGCVRIEGEKILSVDLLDESDLSKEEKETLVLPGLVDVHFHGAMG